MCSGQEDGGEGDALHLARSFGQSHSKTHAAYLNIGGILQCGHRDVDSKLIPLADVEVTRR